MTIHRHMFSLPCNNLGFLTPRILGEKTTHKYHYHVKNHARKMMIIKVG